MFALLRERNFGLLWFAGLVSFTWNSAFFIALPLHIYQLTDSTLATAGTLGASFLPSVLVGSVAGVFVDRWDRQRVMIVSDLLRAALLLPALLAPESLPLLYGIAVTQGTLRLFFSPAEGALLPLLVHPDKLVTANALNAMNNQFGLLLGPVLGAFAYAAFGFSGVLVCNVVSFVASALLVRLIRQTPPPLARARVRDAADGDAAPLATTALGRARAAWRAMGRDWRAGLGVIHGDTALRVLLITTSLSWAAEGIFVTLGLAPLVLDVLGGTAAQVGWIVAAQGIGGIAAGLLVARMGQGQGKRLTRRWLVSGGIIGLGITDLCAANAFRVAGTGTPAVGIAMGCMALGGVPAVAAMTGPQLVVQHHAADAFRGRVFGALASAQGIALLVGIGVGGLLGDAVGLVPILSASAVVRIAAGILAAVWMPRRESNDPAGPSAFTGNLPQAPAAG